MIRGKLGGAALLAALLSACALPQYNVQSDYQRGYDEGYGNGYDEGYYRAQQELQRQTYYQGQQQGYYDSSGNFIVVPSSYRNSRVVIVDQPSDERQYFLPGDQAYYCFNRMDLAVVKIQDIKEAEARVQVLDWVSRKSYWLDQLEVNNWIPLGKLSRNRVHCG